MAHLDPNDLVAQAKKNPSNKRATRVIDRDITVKVGSSINKKHYEVLEAIYETDLLPCPRPLHFVELEPPYNAIVMSTIHGEVLHMGMDRDVVVAVLLEVKKGLDAIQGAMATKFPRDGDKLGSIAEDRCLRFPIMSNDHSSTVSLSSFVDVMMDVCPQRAKSYAHETQCDVLLALTKGEIAFRHMDLNARNILVRDGKLAGVVDWDEAGWYTESMTLYSLAYTASAMQPDLLYSPLLLRTWGYGQSGLYALASLVNGAIYSTYQAERKAALDERVQARKEQKARAAAAGVVFKRKDRGMRAGSSRSGARTPLPPDGDSGNKSGAPKDNSAAKQTNLHADP